MRVVTVASNFPDIYYPTIAPWSKEQVDSIKYYNEIDIEVIAPRPFTLPIKFFPYYKFSKLPLKENSDNNYLIHHPRFPYLIPKKYFFTFTGDLFSFFMYHYILKNIERPDIIHARFPYLDGYGVLKVCKKWNNDLIFDSHGGGDFGQNCTSRFRIKKYKKVIEYATKILCVAQWQVQEALSMGIPKEKLECIPLGVDINKFKSNDKEKIREVLHIEEQIIILYVGQLIKRKGINYLFEAASKLSNSYRKDVKIVIVGDGPERNYLFDLAKKLNLLDFVTFTGKVSEKELIEWYSLADIFILPSLAEGRPTVINEAMASECAIIATNVNGIPEQVKDGYNGFLVKPKNSSMLTEKLNYLLDNKNELIRMGKNSRKRIIDEGWTWEGYAKKVMRVYNLVARNI